MCGLFGAVDTDIKAFQEALITLSHRGPDNTSYEVVDNLMIGHTRLSINDLSPAGNQPLRSDCGRFILTVNGEIYNFLSLREILAGEGVTFKSGSDSEVILHGFARWGVEKTLEVIDGMYAIVLYDRELGKLFVIRDRVGIKPIYYGFVGGMFVWGSELKSLVSFYSAKGNRLAIDNTACVDFLVYGYVPFGKSIYKDIKKLPPGCVATFDLENASINIDKYWELPVSSDNTESPEKITEIIEKSISEHVIADVSVGTFLSGGLDSSIITFEARKFIDNLKTFTIGFHGSEKDESNFAKVVADYVSSEHTQQEYHHASTDLPGDLLKLFDEPFSDFSALPTKAVSKLSKSVCTVALSGDGGDELFFGYSRYFKFLGFGDISKRSNTLSKLAKFIEKSTSNRVSRKFIERLSNDPLEVYSVLIGGPTHHQAKLFCKKFGLDENYDPFWFFRNYFNETFDGVTSLRYLDFHTYLPEFILTKTDRVSMAHSLEVRVPFLSRELVEFAFGLPESLLYSDTYQGKTILKKSYESILPEVILKRPKKGFGLPRKMYTSEGFDELSRGSVLKHFLKQRGAIV
jgi:asparagine synthase (glutamine-hydrolysing)